jgi:hypothetical protein
MTEPVEVHPFTFLTSGGGKGDFRPNANSPLLSEEPVPKESVTESVESSDSLSLSAEPSTTTAPVVEVEKSAPDTKRITPPSKPPVPPSKPGESVPPVAG